MMRDVVFMQPKPEYVHVFADDEIVSEVIDRFRKDFPADSLFVCSCTRCDRLILTRWPAKDLPGVLILACPSCLEAGLAASRIITESN